MKIFDNPSIFGNASTIPADFISAVNAGIVCFRQSRQFWQIFSQGRKCRNSRLSTIPAIPADMPTLPKMSEESAIQLSAGIVEDIESIGVRQSR